MSILDADIRDPEGWQVFLFGVAMAGVGAWLTTVVLGPDVFAATGGPTMVVTNSGAVRTVVPDALRLLSRVNSIGVAVAAVGTVGVLAIDYWVIES